MSPFYHYNTANYEGADGRIPIATTDEHASTYGGGQASFGANCAKNDLQAGFYGFHQNDNQLLRSRFQRRQRQSRPHAAAVANPKPSGGLDAFFLDDKFKPPRG